MKYKVGIRKNAAAALALITAIALSACGSKSTGSTTSESSSKSVKSTVTTGAISGERLLSAMKKALTTAPNTENAVNITLSGTKAMISGKGASQKDGVLTIQKAGTYILKGTYLGRIVVNAPKASVTILLNGATINADDSAALYVAKASDVTLYLQKGTKNLLSDGKTYSFSDELSSKDDDEPNACIYSKSDLLIAGEGSLSVTGDYNNGIRSNDTLRIEVVSLTVKAKKHGISAKDYLESLKAKITVSAGGDAVRATNSKDTKLGYILLSDTTLSATSANDGVQAETVLASEGSTVKVQSGGGSELKTAENESAKGLKAESEVYLLSGTYTLDCSDDAIHSNNTATIKGGSYTISTGDDGVHGDSVTTVSGGTVTINKSYEGLEGATVNITGGTVDITASDDGINAAGGKDESGKSGGDNFKQAGNYGINISGGKIKVSANGDGVDSNGDITVSGGETYIDGPVSGGDSALDYDGTAKITGGIFIATGSSGMAQNFGTESTQGAIMLTNSTASTDGVSIKNASGKTLSSFTPKKQYSAVVISCPAMKKGESYTVTAFGKDTKVTLSDIIYGSGQNNPGNPGGQNGNGDSGAGGEPPTGGAGDQNGGTPPEMTGGSDNNGKNSDTKNGQGGTLSDSSNTTGNSDRKTPPDSFGGGTKPQGDPPEKPGEKGTSSNNNASSTASQKSTASGSGSKTSGISSGSTSSKKAKKSQKTSSTASAASSKSSSTAQKTTA